MKISFDIITSVLYTLIMRIAFLLESSFPNLGVCSLISVLKQEGHCCDLFMASEDPGFFDAFKAFEPDVAGFSFMTGGQTWARRTAARIRAGLPAVKIVFGGVHPTLFPEIIDESDIDAICRGEGEEAFVEYLNDLASGGSGESVRNFWVRAGGIIHRNPLRPLLQDLDSLPDPDRSCYTKYAYTREEWDKYFFAGRGCIYQCSFCANHQFMRLYESGTRYVRRRSTDRVINEIVSVNRVRPLHELVFSDEMFNIDKDWVRRFLHDYRDRIRVPMICAIGVETTDEEQIRLLKAAGCKIVIFGVESGNCEVRRGTLRKPFTREEMLHLASLLHRAGLPFMTTNILGIPGETLEQAWETVLLNMRLQPRVAVASFLMPFPKTDIHDLAVRLRLIDPVHPDSIVTNLYVGSMLRSPDPKSIHNMHRLFTLMVKFPALYPLFRRMTRMPSNPLFELLFLAGFAYYQKVFYQRSMFGILAYGARNIKLFLRKRRMPAQTAAPRIAVGPEPDFYPGCNKLK